MKLRDFLPENIAQNQLNIYFVTSRQYWLGTFKLKNVLLSINPSTKMFIELTDLLTDGFRQA